MPNLKPIRILFVSHSSQWGGAENYLYQLLAGLDRKRFVPLVALPNPGILEEKIRRLGIETLCLELELWIGTPEDNRSGYINFIAGLKRRVQGLVELIQIEQIDLVFTNTAVILDGALAAQLS